MSVLHILFVNFMAGQLTFLIGQRNLVHGLCSWLVSCACGHTVEL